MTNILAEFFAQFNPEEQALIRAKEAEAKIILLQGQNGVDERLRIGYDREWILQPQDSARAKAAATEFVGYQKVLAHRIDPVCTESIEQYLRQLGRVCEGLLAKYGRWECQDALAEMLAEAERLAWLSLGKQLGSARTGTTSAPSKPEQPQAGIDNGRAPVTARPAARKGYRKEVREWMKIKGLKTIPAAAKRLGVGLDTLKCIMSDKGDKRYSDDTLKSVLEKIQNSAP